MRLRAGVQPMRRGPVETPRPEQLYLGLLVADPHDVGGLGWPS
jgi:hypothetical protein